MHEIRVLVVDDHAILRDGIRSLLERQDDMTVIGEAANGQEALEQIAGLHPDIVLMDINMPGMNGLEATRHVKTLYPHVKILILTQHDSQEYISPLLQAGASGYVLKRSGGREVVNAIRQVFEQGAYLEPRVARQVLNQYSNGERTREQGIESLTEREHEVLRLISIGKSNKEIARELVISPKTVSVHRTNIMTKLDVKNSFELIRFVTTHKLVRLDPDDPL